MFPCFGRLRLLCEFHGNARLLMNVNSSLLSLALQMHSKPRLFRILIASTVAWDPNSLHRWWNSIHSIRICVAFLRNESEFNNSYSAPSMSILSRSICFFLIIFITSLIEIKLTSISWFPTCVDFEIDPLTCSGLFGRKNLAIRFVPATPSSWSWKFWGDIYLYSLLILVSDRIHSHGIRTVRSVARRMKYLLRGQYQLLPSQWSGCRRG